MRKTYKNKTKNKNKTKTKNKNKNKNKNKTTTNSYKINKTIRRQVNNRRFAYRTGQFWMCF